jgi:site-specific recombinase XerD
MTVQPIALRDASYKHTEELKKLRNLSISTRRNFQSSYHTFAAHLEPKLGREPLTTDLTAETLEDYFAEYVAAQAAASWELKKSNFTTIVRWLMKKKYIEPCPNFAEDLPVRNRGAKRPRERRLSDPEFLTLLKVAKASHARDYFLCLFLRLTGRRISELVGTLNEKNGMVWGDIRWDEDEVIWDNHKARRYGLKMPLTPRVRAVLEVWKAYYCEELGVSDVRSDWYVFPALTATGISRKGRARKRVLTPQCKMTNANRVIRPLMEKAGIYSEGDGWHVLRKTFANQRKQLASNTGRADAWELTKLSLDHTEERTTRLYIDINEDYERYAAWAMDAPEMSSEGMAAIPELSAFAEPAPETQQKLASGSDFDTALADTPNGVQSVVIDFATARERRALA